MYIWLSELHANYVKSFNDTSSITGVQPPAQSLFISFLRFLIHTSMLLHNQPLWFLALFAFCFRFFCLSARAIIGFSQFYCAHSSWSRALARTGMTAQCVGHCSGIHPCPAINMTLPHLVIFLCLQIPNRPSILAGDSHSAVQRVRQEGLQSSGQPLSSVRVWLITAEVRWGRSTEQHGLTQQPEILGSIFFSFQFIVY